MHLRHAALQLFQKRSGLDQLIVGECFQDGLDLPQQGRIGFWTGAGCRMATAVGALDVADADMSVELCGLQAGVTEHLLDMPQIAAVVQKAGGKGVPEQMAVARLGDPGQPADGTAASVFR